MKMANSRELRKLKKEFQERLKGCEGLEINHPFGKGFEVKKYENDFISSFSQTQERFLTLRDDTYLEVKGAGILNVEVVSPLKLLINLDDKEVSLPYIRIYCKKGIDLKIYELANNPHLYKNLDVFLGGGSSLQYSQMVLSSALNLTRFHLQSNSKISHNTVYFSEGDIFLNTQVYHEGSSSRSEVTANGASAGLHKVTCDALIRIGPQASGSSGVQKLKGLILDDKSSISSEPILEIENNDVTCSHSASISQIREDVIFFLKSRGFSEERIIDFIIEEYFSTLKGKITEDFPSLNIPLLQNIQ